MLTAQSLYLPLGTILALVALLILTDRTHPTRLSSGSFWACYACIFLFGDELPEALVGGMVLLMAALAGTNRLKAKPESAPSHQWTGSGSLLTPALTLPIVTLLGVVAVSQWPWLQQWVDPQHATLVCLGGACVVGWLFALQRTKDTPLQSIREAQRLLEAMGYAVILPQLLACLGLFFNQTGVSQLIGQSAALLPGLNQPFIAVALYCLGMALMTIVMGNAFAAFPVMTAGIGIPLLISVHQANPAVVAAIGMFSGYCGTLMTPMAANFNLVPVALLQLDDPHAVIKAQLPTALPLLLVNIVLMSYLAFL